LYALAAGATTQDVPEPVRIGVLAKRGVNRCFQKWGRTAEYLTREIPGYSFTIVPLGHDAIHPAVGQEEVNFILANPSFYVGLELLHGASRMVTLKNLHLGKAYTVYGGVIFCRAAREDIKHLGDLKGRSFMAVEETSFGGWQMAWRELKEHGIDPHRDFADLSFGGTHDAVVYAVRERKVDAGCVRTDALERMAIEGKIRLEEFQVLHEHSGEEPLLPILHSTRLYPEWPLAKLQQTSDELAEQVAAALLKMSPESPAARAARCAGWTIPHNYQPVHECLKYLRVGPYKDYGKVTLRDVIRQYLAWLLGTFAGLVLIVLFTVIRLNRRLRLAVVGKKKELIERKRAEEAMRQSEEKYRTLYSSMNEGVALNEIIYDQSGKAVDYIILDVNPAYEDMLGLTDKKVIGSKASELYGTGKPPFLEIFAVVAASGEPTTFEASFEPLNKTFRISAFTPAPGRFATIFDDITQSKQFEDQIRLLAKFPEQNPSPILRVGNDGLISYANKYSQPLLEVWDTAVGGFLPEEWRRTVSEALESGQQNEIEFACRDSTYLLFIRPVVDAGYVNIYGLDITERKQAEDALRESEEQLQQSQKMEAIGRLAGGVTHDFNNFLSVITGRSELLLNSLEPESPLRHNVQEIMDAGERAAGLTRQLLAFSRKQVLEPKVLDLNTVVAGMEKMLLRLIGEDVELLTVTDPALGAVKADPGQMEQILLNLAINARDAMPQGGKLTIGTGNVDLDGDFAVEHPGALPGPYVLLAVGDTGCGMDEETQARIFEPFFTTKEQGKGTGLGLSTVYGIVKQSGGHVVVYSILGLGTTFNVFLPRVDEAIRRPELVSGGQLAAGGVETILLAEDEQGVRDLVRTTLKARGYTVLVAKDGVEALELGKRHPAPIHLLLSDVVMPRMSGLDLAERLTLLRPEMKVIYMSGYTDSALMPGDAAGQSAAFLQKPFALDRLCRMVREALGQPAPRTPSPTPQ